MRIPEGEEKEKGTESIFKTTMVENPSPWEKNGHPNL